MSRDHTHVIFGAGQVGRPLARVLLDEGYSVRVACRRPSADLAQQLAGDEAALLDRLSIHAADALDPAAVDAVCRGAGVIYNCTNPPYHQWKQMLRPLFRAVRCGAQRAGARLVVLDNLYMYGRPRETPFDESAPHAPCSVKGRLRAELAAERAELAARGELRFCSGHASDFFGPTADDHSIFGDRFLDRLRKGQPLELFGDPDLPRGYSYIPDVARGLAVLGTRPEAEGHAWHLPVSWTGTSRGVARAFADATGHDGRITIISPWLLRIIGLFSPEARGVPEMLYQWRVPFVPSDARLERAFGLKATDGQAAVKETLIARGLIAPERDPFRDTGPPRRGSEAPEKPAGSAFS